jgi:hypothetical protein
MILKLDFVSPDRSGNGTDEPPKNRDDLKADVGSAKYPGFSLCARAFR